VRPVELIPTSVTLTSEEAVALGAAAVVGVMLAGIGTGTDAEEAARSAVAQEAIETCNATTLTPTEIRDLGVRTVRKALGDDRVLLGAIDDDDPPEGDPSTSCICTDLHCYGEDFEPNAPLDRSGWCHPCGSLDPEMFCIAVDRVPDSESAPGVPW
jgi:hypothetical protein